MKKYMVLVLGLALLLMLAACGSKAAENADAEEVPGDPTGTVTVTAPPQEPQLPEETGEQGQTSSDGETLPDHWTEGGGPAPSGQKMVEATKNYDCAAAEKLGKDRLIAKGLTYNENLNRDECTVDSVHFYGSDAYFKGGQAYLNDVVLRQVERVFPTASAPDAAYTEVRCHVEYSDGSIGYITEIWYKYVGPTE